MLRFLAPCVLPIIPGFLVYLAGSNTGETPKRKDVFIESVFFVLGFSLVFALLGVLLQTVLHNVGASVQTWLSYVGGVLIIFFGLYLLGLIKIPYLERNHTIPVQTQKRSRKITAFLFGLAFAVGWTPCAGAVLGGILTLALTSPVSSFFLLISYALGLGVPFLIVGYFSTEAVKFINRFSARLSIVNKIFGALMIIIGILIFTQNLSLLGNLDALNKLFLK
jgi:cytochrome c-type biogenesis protein